MSPFDYFWKANRQDIHSFACYYYSYYNSMCQEENGNREEVIGK